MSEHRVIRIFNDNCALQVCAPRRYDASSPAMREAEAGPIAMKLLTHRRWQHDICDLFCPPASSELRLNSAWPLFNPFPTKHGRGWAWWSLHRVPSISAMQSKHESAALRRTPLYPGDPIPWQPGQRQKQPNIEIDQRSSIDHLLSGFAALVLSLSLGLL